MIRKLIAALLMTQASFSFALPDFVLTKPCADASPSSSPSFCSTFKSSAQCHCTSSGLPQGMCSNMTLLYNRMISTFGSLQKACKFQRDTSLQNCIDDWNCYLSGGKNSRGELCASTGRACE